MDGQTVSNKVFGYPDQYSGSMDLYLGYSWTWVQIQVLDFAFGCPDSDSDPWI